MEHKLLDIQDCINKNKNFNGELVVEIARNLVIKLDDFIAKLKELKDINKSTNELNEMFCLKYKK